MRLCVPLAIWLGFMLADPFDRATFSYFGIMALLLVTPILLRWHHLLLIACWNLNLTLFFLPGNPALWLPMVALSLGISVLQRTVVGKAQFIPSAQIQWPLFFLAGRGLGHGGTDRRVRDEIAGQFVGGRPSLHLPVFGHSRLFRADGQTHSAPACRIVCRPVFPCHCTSIIGDLYGKLPSALNYIISCLFPASGCTDSLRPEKAGAMARLSGLGFASLSISCS